VFINFVKKQQEIVCETVSDDGNFAQSAATADEDDDEALIDVSEDEPGGGSWFNSLQVTVCCFSCHI